MSQNSSLVKLGPLFESQLNKMFNWRNNPLIYNWCRQFEPITETQHHDWFERIQHDPSVKMYGIYNDGILVGVCGLTSIDYINSRAEFSLYVAPTEFGSGYGERGLRCLLDHAFGVLNLNCVWGESFEGNRAAKTFLKVGFKEEGRRRQFYYRNGEYIDAILFSILRSEYV